ncbi:hypothetical protein IMSAGC008_02162 [Muribaculaceae bacterium]|nr:hypothetical protein IMSAGC008_02162 [Muribaculaceae bacterium]
MRGCWPVSTIFAKISSTLVILKLPHSIKARERQLLRRRKGCVYSIPLRPVVLYRRWPIYTSPTKGTVAATSSAGMAEKSAGSLRPTAEKISSMAPAPKARSRNTYSLPGTDDNFTTPMPAASCPRLCCFSIRR